MSALAAEDPGQGFQLVRVAEVAEHPDNPRAVLGDLDELAASIRSLGLRQPIVVVPIDAFRRANRDLPVPDSARWVLLAGHRRRAAAAQAGVAEIPAWVRTDLASRSDAAETFIVENVHRAALGPLEEARVYALLADLGSSQREIAGRSGVSQAHVSKRIALLRLPQPIQDAVATDTMTVGDALALAALPADRQLPTFQRAQQRRCPVPTAIQQLDREAAVERETQASRERAAGESLTLLPPAGQLEHRVVSDPAEIEELRGRGDLLAGTDSSGRFRYLTVTQTSSTPGGEASGGGGVEPRPALDQLVERLAPPGADGAELADALADAVLALVSTNNDLVRRLSDDLADSIGISRSLRRPEDWLEAVDTADRAAKMRAATVLAIAAAIETLPHATADYSHAQRRLVTTRDHAHVTTEEHPPSETAPRRRSRKSS